MNSLIFSNTDLLVSFQEYNPGWTPGPLTRGKIFGVWVEFEIETVTDIKNVPAVTTTHSTWWSSTTAAHTITITKKIPKQFTVYYCYGEDWIIRKVLPEHINVLFYKPT